MKERARVIFARLFRDPDSGHFAALEPTGDFIEGVTVFRATSRNRTPPETIPLPSLRGALRDEAIQELRRWLAPRPWIAELRSR